MLNINFTWLQNNTEEVWFDRRSSAKDLKAVRIMNNSNFCILYILLAYLPDEGQCAKQALHIYDLVLLSL